MLLAPLPPNEAERLAALRSYDVLDSESDAIFDNLVALAARLTGSPIAFVSLIDTKRQWFKARHGIEMSETPREHAFCAHAILDPERPLVVEDATADPRFQANPLVLSMPNIRAYLGVPLVNAEGHALGSLCVIDQVTRSFDAGAIEGLRVLAQAVIVNLELRRTLRYTRDAALTDSLTGLPNRLAAMAALADAAECSRSLTVIMIDLDHFKETNDGEGHAAGDALLRIAAKRVRAVVRPDDVVARIGGDEFMVILTNFGDRQMVKQVAARISATLCGPATYGTRTLRIGATVSVAAAPDDAATPDIVMRMADIAMMRAKREGRGRIGYARPEDAARLPGNAAIIRAFDADAKALPRLINTTAYLQPIVALREVPGRGTELIAAEALTRWTHPEIGAIPPSELFAVIGTSRSILLGEFVRQQALWAFAALRQAGLGEARLALNLSAAEVARADIALHVAEQVERAGLSLHSVEIEITEEVLLDRVSDRTLEQLAALRGHGARLVLDDFGTGVSGLTQLLRLPFDGVKLDKQFVQHLGSDIRAEQIVRATISFAHELGLNVVAEGVESEEQATMLRAFGCDAAQGFLFARPMPPSLLRTWWSKSVEQPPVSKARAERK